MAIESPRPAPRLGGDGYDEGAPLQSAVQREAPAVKLRLRAPFVEDAPEAVPLCHYQPFQPFQSSTFTSLGDAMVIKSHIKKLKPYQPPLEGRNPQKYMLLEPNL
ncbi:unnamed protein product [Cladocopium goreaui]|uniref:Histidinol-phosphate transaminase n=1 Tax=Cladocopium goreaui TaxID=2562237 RepID=A0A9P1DMG7_9DINO|nr:unnamed protein product [Cladocopium goreaui]